MIPSHWRQQHSEVKGCQLCSSLNQLSFKTFNQSTTVPRVRGQGNLLATSESFSLTSAAHAGISHPLASPLASSALSSFHVRAAVSCRGVPREWDSAANSLPAAAEMRLLRPS